MVLITSIKQLERSYLIAFRTTTGVNIKMLPLSTDIEALKEEFGYEEKEAEVPRKW